MEQPSMMTTALVSLPHSGQSDSVTGALASPSHPLQTNVSIEAIVSSPRPVQEVDSTEAPASPLNSNPKIASAEAPASPPHANQEFASVGAPAALSQPNQQAASTEVAATRVGDGDASAAKLKGKALYAQRRRERAAALKEARERTRHASVLSALGSHREGKPLQMGFGAEFLSFEAADAALRVGVIGTDIGHCLFRGKSRPASRTWICAETHAKVPIANKTFRLDETGALRKAVKSEPSACAEQVSAQERQQERLRKCAVAAATERDMYAEKFVKQLADDTSLCRFSCTVQCLKSRSQLDKGTFRKCSLPLLLTKLEGEDVVKKRDAEQFRNLNRRRVEDARASAQHDTAAQPSSNAAPLHSATSAATAPSQTVQSHAAPTPAAPTPTETAASSECGVIVPSLPAPPELVPIGHTDAHEDKAPDSAEIYVCTYYQPHTCSFGQKGGAVAWGEPLPQSPSSAPRARAGSGKRKRTPQGARDDVGPNGADAAVADISDADGAKNDTNNDKDTEKEADAVAGAVGAVGAVAAVAAVRKPSSLMRGARGFTAKQLAAFSLDEYNRSGRSWTSKQLLSFLQEEVDPSISMSKVTWVKHELKAIAAAQEGQVTTCQQQKVHVPTNASDEREAHVPAVTFERQDLQVPAVICQPQDTCLAGGLLSQELQQLI